MYRRKRDVNASSTHFYARPERAWKQTALVELSQHALGALYIQKRVFPLPPPLFSSSNKSKKKTNPGRKSPLEIRSRTTSTHRLLDETVGLTDATTVLAVKVSAIFVLLTS